MLSGMPKTKTAGAASKAGLTEKAGQGTQGRADPRPRDHRTEGRVHSRSRTMGTNVSTWLRGLGVKEVQRAKGWRRARSRKSLFTSGEQRTGFIDARSVASCPYDPKGHELRPVKIVIEKRPS